MKHYFGKLKISLKKLLHIEPTFHLDIRIDSQRAGSEYGGWEVVMSILDQDSLVYSFGVGEDISFDLQLIERCKLRVHAFDPTPKSITWVKLQTLPDNFVLHEYGVADFDGNVAFNPPENHEHVSHTLLQRHSTHDKAITVEVKKLASILATLGHYNVDLLKMDIEGAEYAVIEDLKNLDLRPKQIMIEFHHRFESVDKQQTIDAVTTLRSMGYKLFAISDSNEEFSFLHQG